MFGMYIRVIVALMCLMKKCACALQFATPAFRRKAKVSFGTIMSYTKLVTTFKRFDFFLTTLSMICFIIFICHARIFTVLHTETEPQ